LVLFIFCPALFLHTLDRLSEADLGFDEFYKINLSLLHFVSIFILLFAAMINVKKE